MEEPLSAPPRTRGWVAALPMYNVTPALGALWRALLADALGRFARAGGPRAGAGGDEPPRAVAAVWRPDDLLLSQTCGYPYRLLGLDRQVRLIATPMFDAEGCVDAHYASVLVVSAAAHAAGATTLAACRGLRAAYNGDDSHSGMNAFRHAVAPHARGARFFASATALGSHLNVLRALSAGQADCAAIDCVTWAYALDAGLAWLRDVRVIGFTARAPGLPLIASRALDAARRDALRDALAGALAADPARARALRLRGFAALAPDDYAVIEQREREAVAHGYPVLA
jgi:ABC-type phosphate/phosphonate transport system substrate-binding protein